MRLISFFHRTGIGMADVPAFGGAVGLRARVPGCLRPIVLACGLVCGLVCAPTVRGQGAAAPAKAASAPAPEPVTIEADQLGGTSGVSARAQGKVLVRRGGLTLRADEVDYQLRTTEARARGEVSIDSPASTLSGPELTLRLDRFEGTFLRPRYYFKQNGAGGEAERFEFVDRERSVVTGASYSSCRREDYPADDPLPWELKTRRVSLDFANNEGIAEGAVLRFYGVPILGAPVMSFPLSDDRKTGWLPPRLEFDTRAGFGVSAPWYWNIAPNHDATLTPILATKRGAGLAAEFRYLQPGFGGTLNAHDHPNDRVVARERWSLLWQHLGEPTRNTDLQAALATGIRRRLLEGLPRPAGDGDAAPVVVQCAGALALRPRLRAHHGLRRCAAVAGAAGHQCADRAAPYQRAPRMGVRGDGELPDLAGLAVSVAGRGQPLHAHRHRQDPWHAGARASRRGAAVWRFGLHLHTTVSACTPPPTTPTAP